MQPYCSEAVCGRSLTYMVKKVGSKTNLCGTPYLSHRGRLSWIPLVVSVEDWFNTYLDYLQYVSWCTNVWFMFMHVYITIDYMLCLPSNDIYVRYC